MKVDTVNKLDILDVKKKNDEDDLINDYFSKKNNPDIAINFSMSSPVMDKIISAFNFLVQNASVFFTIFVSIILGLLATNGGKNVSKLFAYLPCIIGSVEK